MRKVLIIAGPNGAGKTTFAEEFLPNEASCPNYVNADLIAKGLSPFRPQSVAVAAARLLLHQIDGYAERGESFAFETTLSGRIYSRRIAAWQNKGYSVKLYFLRLPDPQFAIRRVALRVKEGGHDVPPDDITRRFHRGLDLLQEVYIPIVDEWAIYDGSHSPPVMLESSQK